MREQTELFKLSDSELLCGYFKSHRFEQVRFGKAAKELGLTRIQILRAWNKLKRDQRLVLLEKPIKTYVLESLENGEQLPDYLSPAIKDNRETYYRDIAEKVGQPLYNVLVAYSKPYGLHDADIFPQDFGEYPKGYDKNSGKYKTMWGYSRNPFKAKG